MSPPEKQCPISDNATGFRFVDGHAQFTPYDVYKPNSSASPRGIGPDNYDWSPLTDQNVQ
jgi:hypothetical protein